MMNARVIVLSLTVSLTLLVMLPSVGLANEALNLPYQKPSTKSLKYDQQMVEAVPFKNKVSTDVSPYTVLSWRPLL